MAFHLALFFSLLKMAVVVALASQDAHPPLPHELYWNSVLPNTQMPKAISQLLQPGKIDINQLITEVLTEIHQNIYPKDSLIHDNPQATLFFLEKDMRPGTTMNLNFTRNSNTANFLPRKTAELIPFSSNELPEIFNQFSVKSESVEANIIKQTIEECEAAGIRGEEKYCATSLESIIDFTTSKLGINVRAFSTAVLEKGGTMSIISVKKLAGDKAVVCHKQNYPYAVFYCHATKPTRAYVVPLRSSDGVKAKAVAICHVDTSEWDPQHLAFQVLKVKPGTIPICHFLPSDHVVWVPTPKSTLVVEPISST
ncbi:dehydration-responsive protein RD22-like [Pyrus ussuriensis x Pyrus communis]|uniref:Dehydration-responsive protein RD22-like n=1 Tax=Pyrus ussuriensis x Pyrus communis TaxID=2448454 RepID=A0A5N5H7Y9_9ROSA|nr:dehydration-responsive protein RD22-like [Pyrus ussuriensis x Pyrus communis]